MATRQRSEGAGDTINLDLRRHVGDLEDWSQSELARQLHGWAVRFNQAFCLEIEIPAIRLDSTYYKWLGSYRRGRNGFGLRHEITLNTIHHKNCNAESLDTLLHELLHEHQILHGKPGKGNYHNKELREMALSLGLVIDERGRSVRRIRGSFTELLRSQGIDVEDYLNFCPAARDRKRPRRGNERRSGKMAKWSCGCTNIRAAVMVHAVCQKCGGVFAPAEPLW